MSSLKYISDPDLMHVTLASDYTAGDGHMHLTAGQGARLPSTGDFWIRTKSGTLYVFKVTARSTDQITVSAVTAYHADGNLSAGTELVWTLCTEALDQFRSDLIQTGAEASKTNEKPGNLYLPNDGIYLRRDTGVEWANWGPLFPCIPPSTSDLSTQINTPTLVTTSGAVYISPPTTGLQFAGIFKSAPATPYTIVVGVICSFVTKYHRAGIALRQSSDGKLILPMIGIGNTQFEITLEKWNNPTSYNSAYFNYAAMFCCPVYWLKLLDNGTNRIFSISPDGINWTIIHTVGRTDFLTADQIGIGVAIDTSGGAPTVVGGATFVHWLLS